MRRPLLLATLLLATAGARAQAEDDPPAIRAAAAAFEAAQQAGDRAALERLLAPDFLFVRGSGRVGDRRDFIAGFTDPASKLASVAIADRLFVRVAPDVAIVGGEARVRGTEGGRPFAQHFRYSDTLVRRDGLWLVGFAQVTGLAP